MTPEREIVEAMIDRAEVIALGEYFEHGEPAKASEVDVTWPAPLDVQAMLARPALPPRMVIDDWWPRGYATLLAGHGGAGKSSIALQLAVATALGREFCGMPCAQLPVLYLMGEDRADVAHWRLQRICDREGISGSQLGALHIVDLVGHDAILYKRHPQAGAILTSAYNELERLLEKTGAKAVFIDGVSDTYGGNENDRAEVKQFVNALVRLVGSDGAVMLIHHVSKPTAAAGTSTEGYSGSTGWHNSVRARWYLHPELERTDDGVTPTGSLILALQKSNLGRSDQSVRLRWDDDAHMFLPDGGVSRFDRSVQETTERRGIVEAMRAIIDAGGYVPAATTGNRTAFHVLSAAESWPQSLTNSRANRRRFWQHVEKLRAMGVVGDGCITREDRHKVQTLVVKATSDEACGHAGNE